MIVSWIMPWGQLSWLRQYDDALARRVFDTPSSHVIGGAVPGYQVTATRMFSSFDAYDAQDMTANAWVCYDLEAGDGFPAPAREKQMPKAFIPTFAAKAKRRGHGLIASPGRDLVFVPGAVCGRQEGENINDAYLRCGIPAACEGAAVLLVQSQDTQKDIPAFTNLLSGAKAQQADPNQALWSGLTTATSTTKHMCDAWSAALPLGVTGCWVTIANPNRVPGGDPAQVKVAADFFRWAVD
jgi:hypothetical protein